jgi:hypothetical protein
MTYLAAAWAWVMGLSWFGKAAAGLTVLSPLLGVVGYIWNAVVTVANWVFQGLELCLTHPVVLSVVAGAFFGGMFVEHKLNAKQIESYKIDAQNVAKKVQGAVDVEKAKAEAAIHARDAAKAQPLPLIDPEAFTVVAPVVAPKASAPTIALNPARPDSVRKPAAVRSRAKCDAVFCF